jgi:hypothetical protein
LIIINYTIRAMVVIIGILLLSGVLIPPNVDNTLYRVMGIIFTLFGIYRITTYYSQLKKMRREEDDE